jgi:hypothetical protein
MHDHANGRGDIGHSSFVMTGETPVALVPSQRVLKLA